MDSDESSADNDSVVSPVTSGVSKTFSTSSSTNLTVHSPVAWGWFSLRTIVLTILPLLSTIGAYGTWTLAGSNGTFDIVKAVLAQDEPKFPGTQDLLLLKYTGLKFLDRQLVVLVTFFAPVVDAESSALNLFSIWGFGQFGAVWTLMVMESMRLGNKGRAVSFIGVVGFMIQNISYTITTPLWLFVHIITSPISKPFSGAHATNALLIPSLDLRILPISITLSYVIPSLLMALPAPDIVTSDTHQLFIALWQPFPLLTVMIHHVLRTTIKYLSTRLIRKDPQSRQPTPLGASYLSNAKHIYRFVLTLCMVTHIPVLLLTLFPSSLIPSNINSPALHAFASQTPSLVFLPSKPLPSTQISSIASGVQNFLQWDIYIGSTAFILWAVLLYCNTITRKTIVDPNTGLLLAGEMAREDQGTDWKGLGWKVFRWGVVGGPIGAVGVLLWERDEIVRQKIKQGL